MMVKSSRWNAHCDGRSHALKQVTLAEGPVIVVKALQASPTELIEYVLHLRDVILV
jgi:hypothetical protein